MAAVPQKFCLKWNDFQSIVISMFDNLRHDEELVDVTLCCDGKKIKAHRMVLSACSPYFKEVLKENPCHHPVFFMRDIPYADLSSLIEFIYTGEVNVSQTDLSSFLKTAEMLKVKGLTDNDKTTDVPPCSAPPPQAQAGSRPSGQPAVADRRSAAGGQAEKRPVPAGAPAVSAFRSDPQAPASKRSRADRPPSPTGPLAASESPGQLPGGQALAELAESFPAAPSADPVVQVARYETSLVKTEAVAFEDGGDFEASLEREGAYDDASLDHSLLEFKAVADRDQLTTSQGNSESLSGMFFGEDPAGGPHLGDVAVLADSGRSGLPAQHGSGSVRPDVSNVGGAGETTSTDPETAEALRRLAKLTCPTCQKVFRHRESLYNHAQAHRGLTTCPRCQKVYSTKRNLARHLQGKCQGAGAENPDGVPRF